ncbi:hypothetical protein LAZ67_7003510 [Cordylochernes scorpioides]|uniref:Alpha-aspartyl dipeptidase n=1 Tax=Cordylochernes scorpioides TaxID=51811 RepID=A0ABY6KQJ3_9ARAC|nr:hypothetical protein LAZ67_7003510 [Cordylochernes scorpioides]
MLQWPLILAKVQPHQRVQVTKRGYDTFPQPTAMSTCALCRNGVSKVLFIPYAKKDYVAYTKKIQPAFEKMGLEVESITDQPDAVAAAKSAQAYFIGGGNTFLLLRTLQDKGLVPVISERVLKEGVPYMGASAGTNVATVNICTTNDMPIIQPQSFSALGLVPFNINPHYVDPDPSSTHMGETREERIREYHEVSDNPPVLKFVLFVKENPLAELTAIGHVPRWQIGERPSDMKASCETSRITLMNKQSRTNSSIVRKRRKTSLKILSSTDPGLREGCMLSVDGDCAKLLGQRGAKLFIREGEQKELSPGDDKIIQHGSDSTSRNFRLLDTNEWPKWRKRFERYLVACGMKKKGGGQDRFVHVLDG